MVEEDAVAGIHAVGLAVIDGDPVGVELGHGVGAARVEGRRLALRHFLHQAVELRGRGLVEARLAPEPEEADGLEQAQRSQRIDVGGVFRRLEAHRDMGLGAEVVDLVGLDVADDPGERRAVGQVAVVQAELAGWDCAGPGRCGRCAAVLKSEERRLMPWTS